MWWILLALMGGVQGDAPESATTTATTVAEAADEAMAAAQLAALPEVRQHEVRCATIASAVMYDVGRGVSKRSYGLTPAKAETLAGRLAGAIMAETGASDTEVRAMYKQDFEAFTYALLGDGQDQKTAERTVAAAIDDCQPLYASIDVSSGGDGVVKGLAQVSAVTMPDTPQCYAILTHISIGIPAFKDEAKEFAAMKARLAVLHRKQAGAATDADLAAAVAAFDGAAFDALPEEEAEPKLAQCFGLAAE